MMKLSFRITGSCIAVGLLLVGVLWEWYNDKNTYHFPKVTSSVKRLSLRTKHLLLIGKAVEEQISVERGYG